MDFLLVSARLADFQRAKESGPPGNLQLEPKAGLLNLISPELVVKCPSADP